MSRRWFCLASVLAVTVLMVAADATQAQGLRRFGRRNRDFNNGNYYDNGPMAPLDRSTTLPDMQGPESRSFYRGPGEMEGPQNEMHAYLEVRLPPSATVTIEGERTTQSGTRRLFVSPPVEPGHRYVYDLTARWMEDGREVVRTEQVHVSPGRTTIVDLRTMAPEPEQQPMRSGRVRRRA
jgi:uncharacterized protein (TIGR03000 family)